jgi:hypothetical protein
MKISKFFVVLFICLTLNSCAVTNGLWAARNKGMTVTGFFIDQESNRVVLVSRLEREKPSQHYSIKDPTNRIKNYIKFL